MGHLVIPWQTPKISGLQTCFNFCSKVWPKGLVRERPLSLAETGQQPKAANLSEEEGDWPASYSVWKIEGKNSELSTLLLALGQGFTWTLLWVL